jgi:hypothetical protein
MDYEPGPELRPDETPTAPGMYQESEPWQPLQYPYPPAQQTPSQYAPYSPQYQPSYPPPVTPGPLNAQSPEQQVLPKRRGRRGIWLIVGAVALVVACCALVLALGAIITPLAKIQSAVATGTAAAKATEQTNKNNAMAYINLVSSQVLVMQADFKKVATDCQAADVKACRADYQKIHEDALAFRAFLNRHHPPLCLDSADKELRAGLTEYIDGSALVMQGIDDKETSTINTGNADFTTGNIDVQQAGNEMGLASVIC